MSVKKIRNYRKRVSNQGIAMVLGQGGVYNSRVLSGLIKTSHKSISCVLFALTWADVDTENWLRGTCPMFQLSNYIVNRRWCARSLSTPPQSPIQVPPGSNRMTTVGISLAASSRPGLPGLHPHERLGRDA